MSEFFGSGFALLLLTLAGLALTTVAILRDVATPAQTT
jgi:hypothetical protein